MSWWTIWQLYYAILGFAFAVAGHTGLGAWFAIGSFIVMGIKRLFPSPPSTEGEER